MSNPDVLVAAAVNAATVASGVRPLGSRGSRAEVREAGPAELTPAAAAVLAMIPAWWRRQASAAGLAGRWLEVTTALEAAPPVDVPSGGDTPLPPGWENLSPEEVGGAYVAALSPATRARHGRHYTPRVLADHLWFLAREALELSPGPQRVPGKVWDPACGSGALLLPPLREHLRASYDIDPSLALAGLPSLFQGTDTDPAAVWVANVVLAAEMLPTLARIPDQMRRPLPTVAAVGDGLTGEISDVRVTLMNPPYGRVRLGKEERERYSEVLYGHANLYGLFIAAAVRALDEQGVLASLTPTSFTSGRYFSRLRGFLGREAPMSAVTFVEDRSGVFSSVLQETCLATFERRRRQRVQVRALGSSVTTIAKVKVQPGESPWLLPRRSDDAPVAAAAAGMGETLASFGWRASTGPLVWNRRSSDLHRHWGRTRSQVIWAADLDGGRLHRDPSRDEMRYLALTQPSDRDVMVLSTPAILVQRTTAPEQNRRLVAAALTAEDLAARGGGVTVENHVNVLRPVSADELDARLLLRLLRTQTLDRVVRVISGSVALSAYELESIPLPSRQALLAMAELDDEKFDAAVAAAYLPRGR